MTPNRKFSRLARIILGLGLGIMLATNCTQGDNPVQGLALLVIWPALFIAGMGAGIIVFTFVPRPKGISSGISALLLTALSIAMAALPALRGYLYLSDVAGRLTAILPGASVINSDYTSPLEPRLVALNLHTSLPDGNVLTIYDRELRQTGWHSDSQTPFSNSWVDDAMNRITVSVRSGGLIEILWTRHSD